MIENIIFHFIELYFMFCSLLFDFLLGSLHLIDQFNYFVPD